MEQHFRITNYYDHPTDPNHIVFHFLKEEQANEFEKSLKENDIEYEKFVEKGENIIWMFGIRKKHENVAIQLNFRAIGKHREPFIPSTFFRWAIILFTFLCIGLALIGYIKEQSDATKKENKINSNP